MALPVPTFKLLLYGPELPASGMQAHARFEGEFLTVVANRTLFMVAAQDISLALGGYDGRQWLIRWVDKKGQYSAMLQGDKALQAIINAAPKGIGRELQRSRQNQGHKEHRFNPALILILLGLALPMVLLWTNSTYLSLWVVSHIDLNQEQRLGDLAYAQIRPQLKLLNHGRLPATLTALGKRLAGDSNYHYHFHIAVDPQIDAYTLPGGHIVVNTGLIKIMDSAEELAGLLAHEIGHVEHRHQLRSLVLALDWRVLLGAATGNLPTGQWNDLATRLRRLHFSRQQENEADAEALQKLGSAGMPPQGLDDFYRKLAGMQDIAPRSCPPPDAERLALLHATVSRQPLDEVYPLGIIWERIRGGP